MFEIMDDCKNKIKLQKIQNINKSINEALTLYTKDELMIITNPYNRKYFNQIREITGIKVLSIVSNLPKDVEFIIQPINKIRFFYK